MNEDLRNWFREKWVRMDTKGNIKGDCAREEGEGKPKCLPLAKASNMSKEKRAAAARRKRREDPVADRPGKGGKPVNVATEEASTSELIKKSHEKRGAPGTLKAKIKGPITLEKVRQLKNRPNATTLDKKQANFYINMHTEEYLEEKNTPTNPSLWSKAKSLARSKFDVYPSAYANGWAAKWYKSKGGGWKSVNEEKSMKSLKEILEGVVVMSDYKLDKRGHKYKAHRKTMSPKDEDMKENFNPYDLIEAEDYPHVGTGTSKNMQMARDIATNKARSSMMKAKYGDDVSGKDIPAYDEDKLDLKADDKGNYVATVKMREKKAAGVTEGRADDAFADLDKEIEKNRGTKKTSDMLAEPAVQPAKPTPSMRSEPAIEPRKATKLSDMNPLDRAQWEKEKKAAGIKENVNPYESLQETVIQGHFINDDDWYVVHNKTKKIVNSVGGKSRVGKDIQFKAGYSGNKAKIDDDHTAYTGMKVKSVMAEGVEQVDEISKKMAASYISKAAKDIGYEANLSGFAAGQKTKGYNPTEETPKEVKRHKGIAKALKRLVKEARIEELNWNTLQRYASKAQKVGMQGGPKSAKHLAGSQRAKEKLKYGDYSEEAINEISKATATSYVRKKMSEIGKRSGDANPKDFENLARAYKRMGVSDKAMKD